MTNQPYSDDPSIPNETALWRRIHPDWIVRDDNHAVWRVSSAAFDDSRDRSPLSVLVANVVIETGRTAGDVLVRFSGYGLAAITAGDARSLHQSVARTPTDDEPAHASVIGRKTLRVRRALASASAWVHCPK